MPQLSTAEPIENRPPSEGADLQLIDPILKSRSFERAVTSRQLLEYLWVHQTEEFSEYTLALEALGRRPDFDSKFDATVRVQVSRLRQRIYDFYQSQESAQFPIILSIPVGTHRLQIAYREISESQIAQAEMAAPPPPPISDFRITPLTYIFGLFSICLLVVVLIMAFQIRGMAPRTVEAHTLENQFWSNFVEHGKMTRIVLSTPTFFEVDGSGYQLRVRDLSVNDFNDWQKSSALKKMADTSVGGLKVVQSYTVASDTFAAISLARYLDRNLHGNEIQFGSSNSVSMDDLDHENEIVLGSYFTMHPFQGYTSQLSFQMEPFEQAVSNRSPEPGEPARFEEKVVESGHRGTQPGIIAILAGKNPGYHLMILQARHTSALVSFLTSSAGAEQLQKLWKLKGSPASYEVIVESEMVDDHPIRTWPVLLHAIHTPK